VSTVRVTALSEELHTPRRSTIRVTSGFDAYLPKPISFDRLMALITERLAILTRASASS